MVIEVPRAENRWDVNQETQDVVAKTFAAGGLVGGLFGGFIVHRYLDGEDVSLLPTVARLVGAGLVGILIAFPSIRRRKE